MSSGVEKGFFPMHFQRAFKTIAIVAVIILMIPGAVQAERRIEKDRNQDFARVK